MSNKISCEQCDPMMINGTFCHETGCINIGKTFIEGNWIKFVACWNCGCDVEVGESCDCMDHCEPEEIEEY